MTKSEITYIDQRTSGGKVSFEAIGFANVVEAADWASNYEDRQMGYSPLAKVSTNHETGAVSVFCSHWSSCD